jgi:alpha-glucosidase
MGRAQKDFGSVVNYSKSAQGLSFSSDFAFAAVDFYEDRVVRLRYSTEKLIDKHSYAVVAKASDTNINFEEDDSKLILKSSSLNCVIDKSDARISFYNSELQLINSDGLPVNWLGTEVSVYKKLFDDEKFVGLGEKTGPLNRRGHAYTNWNTDKFAYAVDQDPLYASIPFYIGIQGGLMYGIFLDNTHKTTFNFGASSERFSWFNAEDGLLDYYFIYGETIAEIIEAYSRLCGRMPMPARWALGFQQCRYSYYPDSEIYQLADTFRAKQIPCDVIYLDIHYMDEYRAFSFDRERFPKPAEMIDYIRQKGIKTAVILDPGIAVKKDYAPYESGIEQDVFVKYPDGENYVGEVWPGRSHFPDFTAADTRKWWAGLMPFYTELGVKGFWNDMNEPAAWGQCLPNNLIFELEGEKGSHREARNVYGMQMSRATREGVEAQMPNERPFLLTRAAYCGVQRYAALWTGDNVSSDEHLMLGQRLINSLGLSGISFCGNDVGGFAGEASPALYARWISLAAFQPFFRAHTAVNTKDAEPWSFGEEVEQIARNYISLRYRLMPYLYAMMRLSEQKGIPLNRSMVFEFPFDERTYKAEYQHQFFCGDNLLVAAVESNKDFVKVWLPESDWFCFWTGKRYSGNQEIVLESPLWRLPVFVRSGAIVPMQPTVQHLDEASTELILHIYGNSSGRTILYDDDGISNDYLKEVFSERLALLDSHSLVITAACGNYKSRATNLKVVFHGFSAENIRVNGIEVKYEFEDFRQLQPITGIDTFFENKGENLIEKSLQVFSCRLITEKISIEW